MYGPKNSKWMNSDNVTTKIVKKYYPSKSQNLLSEHQEDAVTVV